MCDYSLCGLPTRLATEGEVLEVHRFSTGSIGMASYAELHSEPERKPPEKVSFWARVKVSLQDLCKPDLEKTAICIPPGAYLILKGIPAYLRERYGLGEEEGVRFTQTSAAANTHRDAIQFKNGCVAGLQELPRGLRVEVLSLARIFDSGAEFSAPLRASTQLSRW